MFDDVLEVQSIAGIDFGGRLFASCWVKQDAEDIAQWSMYGDNKRGVRVSLQDDPFEWYKLDAYHQIPGTEVKWEFKDIEAPFQVGEVIGDGYLIVPETDRSRFLKEVCYVEDVVEAYKRHIRQEGEVVVIDGYPTDLAKYKWNRWAFQREHRFVLTTLRGPRMTESSKEYGERFSELVRDPDWTRQSALSSYIDLKIGARAWENCVFTVGPLCPDGDREEVRRLRDRYAPSARIATSELEGKIRNKA